MWRMEWILERVSFWGRTLCSSSLPWLTSFDWVQIEGSLTVTLKEKCLLPLNPEPIPNIVVKKSTTSLLVCGYYNLTSQKDQFILTVFVSYRVKVFPHLLFHTQETHHHGSNCQVTMLLNKSSSMQEKVWLHLQLVLSWEMLMVFLKPRLSLVTRSWEFWNQTVWLQKFQKICTSWLRKLFQLENIWKETEKIKILNSDWFWLNQESTDWLDTTELLLSCHQTGNTNLLLLLLWLLK